MDKFRGKKVKILFVCLGNICRSPMAEAIFRSLVKKAGLTEKFQIDSAGFSPQLEGHEYHPQTIRICEKYGIPVTGTSRPITPADLLKSDYILAMDEQIFDDLVALDDTEEFESKIRMMMEFALEDFGDLNVPDPMGKSLESFEHVFFLLSRSCEGLLGQLRVLENI